MCVLDISHSMAEPFGENDGLFIDYLSVNIYWNILIASIAVELCCWKLHWKIFLINTIENYIEKGFTIKSHKHFIHALFPKIFLSKTWNHCPVKSFYSSNEEYIFSQAIYIQLNKNNQDNFILFSANCSKLDRVKTFATLLVNELEADDFLGIVTFGTKAKIIHHLAKLDDHRRVR